jgi:transposase
VVRRRADARGRGQLPQALGVSWQKPLRRAYEQDPKAIEAWLKTAYPAITTKAQHAGGIVLWADQTGLRADHVTGRTWGRAGHTPVVRTTGKRFGLSVMSASSNTGHLYVTVDTGRMNAAFFCEVLERLYRSTGCKVHLIVDRHPAHTAVFTAAWLAKRAGQIELHFLPGYAPELNPTEILDADLEREVLGSIRPVTFEELNVEVRSVLHRLQKLSGRIMAYFGKAPVRYASA